MCVRNSLPNLIWLKGRCLFGLAISVTVTINFNIWVKLCTVPVTVSNPSSIYLLSDIPTQVVYNFRNNKQQT